MKTRLKLHIKPLMIPVVAFATLLALSGCVAYPGYGYGYGGGGYYGAPAASVVVPIAPVYGWGGGWGRGGRGWGGGGWGHGGRWR